MQQLFITKNQILDFQNIIAKHITIGFTTIVAQIQKKTKKEERKDVFYIRRKVFGMLNYVGKQSVPVMFRILIEHFLKIQT